MPTQQQLLIIQQQLGRTPRGLVDIAAFSSSGVPLVLHMRSLVDDQPFPTLYWLSSIDLCKAIGQIEGNGWVKVIESRLQQEPDLLEQYQRDQARYVAKRWQTMNSVDRKRIESLKMTALFDQYGIGGITDWNRVRCLHMQYAHHLVDGNCIGQLLDEVFSLNDFKIER